MQPPQAQRGVTLIETALVIVILAITLGAALPSFAAFINQLRLDGAAAQLATDLQYMRTEAVARNQPVNITFHDGTGGTCYVLHTGPAQQCHCNGPGPASCTGDAVEIKSVWLPSGDGIALHASRPSTTSDPLHGTSSPANTIRILDRQGRAVHHVVNLMGRVRSCSPGAAVRGYDAC